MSTASQMPRQPKGAEKVIAATTYVVTYLFTVFCNLFFSINVEDIFISDLRDCLFTGLLTIGGFLLTLKLFILIQLKEKLYDSKEYGKRFSRMKTLNGDLKLYSPLTSLGELLVSCVAIIIMSSLLQITVGFIGNKYAVATCLGSAAMSLSLVVYVWFKIKTSLETWFKILNEHNE